jgi:hypothetical protein
MSQSITDKIKEHVNNSIDAFSQGETIEWDVFPIMGPEGNVAHCISLVGSSPVLGETIQTSGLIMGAKDAQGENIAQYVQQALEAIRQQRTKLLSTELPTAHTLQVPGLSGS